MIQFLLDFNPSINVGKYKLRQKKLQGKKNLETKKYNISKNSPITKATWKNFMLYVKGKPTSTKTIRWCRSQERNKELQSIT